MSRTPSRPGLDQLVGSVEQRVAILEALTPESLLDVTDGVLDIPDTSELFIGDGLTLTNPSGGVAAIAADFGTLTAYTPALTASGTNPSLGGSGANVVGAYVHMGVFCWVFGLFDFGLSPSAGVGDWEISLPITNPGGGTFEYGAAAHFQTNPVRTNWWNLDVIGATTTTFKLAYTPTWPVGVFTFLDSSSLGGSPWTLQLDDRLTFEFMYYVGL